MAANLIKDFLRLLMGYVRSELAFDILNILQLHRCCPVTICLLSTRTVLNMSTKWPKQP